MTSRTSRFIQRVTRSVRTCVQRVIRRKSRRNSTVIIIPAVNVSRSSAGRGSAEIASVGTETTSTEDVHEVATADTSATGSTRISESRASISTTGATVGVSDAVTPGESVFSLPEAELFGSPFNILEGIGNE